MSSLLLGDGRELFILVVGSSAIWVLVLIATRKKAVELLKAEHSILTEVAFHDGATFYRASERLLKFVKEGLTGLVLGDIADIDRVKLSLLFGQLV